MSTLRVNNLTAVGGTGTITVPTGNQVVQTGAILQVVSTTKTDTFSTSSTSYVDITGLSVSITPSSASNKILVIPFLSYTTDSSRISIQIVRGSTAVFIGNAASNRIRSTTGTLQTVANSDTPVFLDSPNTTSSVTYKVQILRSSAVGSNAYVNRGGSDSDDAGWQRMASSITVMEVAG